ncbi:MAG: GtrA family protein [Ruminococcus sp.]|nr:GtrA family protein [Ruminococcus sp.]
MDKYCAVIPSLDPDERLASIVKKLRGKGFEHIILVNDGSRSDKIFKRLEEEFGCCVITHFMNFGKGRGMKNAMNFYMNNFADSCSGIVFADGDDQHDIDDICACCRRLAEDGNSLVLGVRDFGGEGVPPKSRFGNRLTSGFFRLFCGLDISDTQTGLRAVPNELIPRFAAVKGERFDFETNMLLEAGRLGIPIKEVPIKTIYEDNNSGTHFNPIKDSLAIYKMLIGYASSSLISCLTDLAVYQTVFTAAASAEMGRRIMLATFIARAVSSLLNYALNRGVVFKSAADPRLTLIKYYILCIIQAAASFGGVYGLSHIFGEKTLIVKMIVDTLLFAVSFKVQQVWVFRKKRKDGGK